MRALSDGLGGGEKRVKQKLEIARRHKSGVTSQSSDWSVSFPVTWPFLLAIPVSFLCLAGPCLAGGGPAWRPACCARGLDGRGLAGGWLAGDLPAAARLGPGRRHTAHSTHTHKTHTPPHLERGEPGCVLSKLTLPLVADTGVLAVGTTISGDSEVSSEHTHVTLPHIADCTAVFSCCLAGDK